MADGGQRPTVSINGNAKMRQRIFYPTGSTAKAMRRPSYSKTL